MSKPLDKPPVKKPGVVAVIQSVTCKGKTQKVFSGGSKYPSLFPGIVFEAETPDGQTVMLVLSKYAALGIRNGVNDTINQHEKEFKMEGRR